MEALVVLAAAAGVAVEPRHQVRLLEFPGGQRGVGRRFAQALQQPAEAAEQGVGRARREKAVGGVPAEVQAVVALPHLVVEGDAGGLAHGVPLVVAHAAPPGTVEAQVEQAGEDHRQCRCRGALGAQFAQHLDAADVRVGQRLPHPLVEGARGLVRVGWPTVDDEQAAGGVGADELLGGGRQPGPVGGGQDEGERFVRTGRCRASAKAVSTSEVGETRSPAARARRPAHWAGVSRPRRGVRGWPSRPGGGSGGSASSTDGPPGRPLCRSAAQGQGGAVGGGAPVAGERVQGVAEAERRLGQGVFLGRVGVPPVVQQQAGAVRVGDRAVEAEMDHGASGGLPADLDLERRPVARRVAVVGQPAAAAPAPPPRASSSAVRGRRVTAHPGGLPALLVPAAAGEPAGGDGCASRRQAPRHRRPESSPPSSNLPGRGNACPPGRVRVHSPAPAHAYAARLKVPPGRVAAGRGPAAEVHATGGAVSVPGGVRPLRVRPELDPVGGVRGADVAETVEVTGVTGCGTRGARHRRRPRTPRGCAGCCAARVRRSAGPGWR
ncbi:hypothetical protein SVIOM342S_08039 [Streptomyces violaceorubidus]